MMRAKRFRKRLTAIVRRWFRRRATDPRGAWPAWRVPGATAAVVVALTTGIPGGQPRAPQRDFAPEPYFGQPAPGLTPVLFAPDVVAAKQITRTPVFTAEGREAFWSTSLGQNKGRLMAARLGASGWSAAEPLPFSTGEYFDHNPAPSFDGTRLVFASNRPIAGKDATTMPGTTVATSDLWMSERTPAGWTAPVALGPDINTSADDDVPVLTRDGTLYFGSSRPGASGPAAIYRSRFVNGRYAAPEILPAPITSSSGEMLSGVAADESLLIFLSFAPGAAGGLHASYRQADGRWGKPVKLDAAITSLRAYFLTLSPDGRHLFFTSPAAGGSPRIYWVDARIIRNLPAAERGISAIVTSTWPGALPDRQNLTIDARVELFAIIFRLAGSREYGQCRIPVYASAIDRHFAAYRAHTAVELARQLRDTDSIGFDAPMHLAVRVTDPPALAERAPFDRPAVLSDKRWQADKARAFVEAARRFAVDTRFDEFLRSQQPLFELTLARQRKALEAGADLGWFDRFFGAASSRAPKLIVIGGLTNGPASYGASFAAAEGADEIYAIVGVDQADAEGQPVFPQRWASTVMHELSHSRINPLVDRNLAALQKAGQAVFQAFEQDMRALAYGEPRIVLYETLVRAATIRYVDEHEGPAAAAKALQSDRNRMFLWMPDTVQLLAHYERDRAAYPTLDAFVPRIVAHFDRLAQTAAEMSRQYDQAGPKVVASSVQDGARDVDPNLAAIVAQFDRPMNTQNISVMFLPGEGQFPTPVGRQFWNEARTVFTMPVLLEPDRDYAFGLNTSRSRGHFESADGFKLKPVLVRFRTRPAKPGETLRSLDDYRPTVTALNIPNGAADVDPALKEITIRFSRPMRDQSWSLLTPDDEQRYPKFQGQPRYDATRTVLTLAVALEANHDYQFMLNWPNEGGFVSEEGVPLKQVVITFRTRAAKHATSPGNK